MKIKTIGLLACLSGFVPVSHAQSNSATSITLKNGLKVIVCEKTDNDYVEFETWYRTGSKDEKPGIRGMAHLFEHMMFRGTVKYPGKSVFDNVEKVGGTLNAYTSFDRTVYHEYVPVTALEKMMDLESDRMANLVVTQEILNTEREVVGEELRNGTNNWYARMDDERYPFLYPKGHPYEVNVIGFLPEITQFTAPQCMDFYNNYYSPNNAFLVVVGNVKAADVFAMAEKYFGPISKQLDIRKKEHVPDLDTAKVRVSDMNINFPVQIYSYVLSRPAAGEKDFYAVQMLTGMLFTADNSILNNRLVKKEHSAFGFNGNLDPWSLFQSISVIDVIMNATPGNVKVKRAIREEIDKVAANGLPQEMIDDYISSYENSEIMSNYESANISAKLGTAEYYLHDYSKSNTLGAEYRKVTSEDLKRVAGKYFSEERLQFINIKPE
jgi:zinc protease